MKKIVLDIQSGIHAHNMERMLMQELESYQVVVSESPDSTAEWCKTHKADVLLMEIKAYSPWMLEERLEICKAVRRQSPECRIVLSVDENSDPALAERVKQCKKDGIIDAFIYNSTSEKYLAALLDSV